MAGNSQEFFYKYMTRATARVVLEQRTLRWSTPGTLNDPYDVQFNVHLGIDRAAVKAAALQTLWDAHYGDNPPVMPNALGQVIGLVRGLFPRLSREEFDREYGEAIDEGLAGLERRIPETQTLVREFLATCKILCLTELPDNVLMWTHYAERHQGIVLRFKSVDGLDSPWKVARPVEYLPEMPRLLDDAYMANILLQPLETNVRLILDRLIYTKSDAWAYEREWRLFTGAGRNPTAIFEDVPFHPLELDAVILGCRMADEDRHTLSELAKCRYPHVQVYVADLVPDRFKIELKPEP